MFCPNCGTELPAGTRFCPSCGSVVSGSQKAAYSVPGEDHPVSVPTAPSVKKKMGCLPKIMIVAVILIASLLIAAILFSVDNTREPAAESTEKIEGVLPVTLCDDNHLYAELVQIQDYKDIYGTSAQDLEVCYLGVSAENRYPGDVTLVLDDISVNDTMTHAMSGLPFELLEGKSGINSFFFSYGDLPISEKSEIESIEFRIVLMDDAWAEIYRSDLIRIDIKQ